MFLCRTDSIFWQASLLNLTRYFIKGRHTYSRKHIWAASHEKVPYVLSRCHTKRRAAPALLLVWHRRFRIFWKFLTFFFLSQCHTKRWAGARWVWQRLRTLGTFSRNTAHLLSTSFYIIIMEPLLTSYGCLKLGMWAPTPFTYQLRICTKINCLAECGIQMRYSMIVWCKIFNRTLSKIVINTTSHALLRWYLN